MPSTKPPRPTPSTTPGIVIAAGRSASASVATVRLTVLPRFEVPPYPGRWTVKRRPEDPSKQVVTRAAWTATDGVFHQPSDHRYHSKESAMATGETGFDDVTFDLISVQYHSLKAGHDYGQYVRDAENAGQDEIASFFREVMEEDSRRAQKVHDFLAKLGGTDNTSPQG
jgi:hypothetical protein